MAITTTTNLGLSKPDYDAVADIAVLNNNSDTIDAMFDGTHLVETINGVSPVAGEVTVDVGVTSVNGQTGAVTVTQRTVQQLIDIIYPVGTYYETTDSSFDPNVAWSGTTWTRITDGRVLIAGGGDYTIGTNYGEKTHKITTSEMPTHSHTASTANNGNHTHTRGTMNITGYHDSSDDDASYVGGAFYFSSRSTAHNDHSQGGNANTVVNFDASRNWTGATSSAGAHSHTVTVGNTGSGTAMSLVQPSKAVARWLRTA